MTVMGFVTTFLLALAVFPEMVAAARIKQGKVTKNAVHRVTDESTSPTLPTLDGPRWKKYSKVEVTESLAAKDVTAAKGACRKAYQEFVCDPVLAILETSEASPLKDADLGYEALRQVKFGCTHGCAAMWCGSAIRPNGKTSENRAEEYLQMCKQAELETYFPKHAEMPEPTAMSGSEEE